MTDDQTESLQWLRNHMTDDQPPAEPTGSVSGPRRNPDHDRRGWEFVIAFAVSLFVLVTGGVLISQTGRTPWVSFRSVEDYPGPGEADVMVTIPTGTTVTGMAKILVAADVVKTTKAFDRAAAATSNVTRIQAGRYKLKTKIPAATAIEMLLNPANVIRIQFTVIEGLRLSQAVPLMAKGASLPAENFTAALKAGTDLGLPTWSNNNAEGFLYPDTYFLSDNVTAVDVIRLMTAEFQQVSADLNFEAKAANLNLTPYQALIVASIVQAEVNQQKYMPQVARVIYNRLAIGMPLQMDSTIHYAVGKDGSVTTTDADRAVASPYNTYRNVGLTPTPINSPGREAMAAAVAPSEGAWLYFVTVDLDTGETLFADNMTQHSANVATFRTWCAAHPGRC